MYIPGSTFSTIGEVRFQGSHKLKRKEFSIGCDIQSVVAKVLLLSLSLIELPLNVFL